MKQRFLFGLIASLIFIGLSVITRNPIVVGVGVWGCVLIWYLGKKDGLLKRRIGLIATTLLIMLGFMQTTGNVVLSAIVTWIIVVFGYLVMAVLRHGKRLKLLEEECDPLAFLEATMKQLKITGKSKRDFTLLQIDMVAGEILLGESEQAMERLLTVDKLILSDRNGSRFAYYMNMIACYYELGNIEQAEELFEEKIPTLAPVNRQMRIAMKALMAERLFYLKRYDESTAQFYNLLHEKLSKRMRLSVLFNLAKIEESRGEWESALVKYQEVAANGNQLSIAKEAKGILQDHREVVE